MRVMKGLPDPLAEGGVGGMHPAPNRLRRCSVDELKGVARGAPNLSRRVRLQQLHDGYQFSGYLYPIPLP